MVNGADRSGRYTHFQAFSDLVIFHFTRVFEPFLRRILVEAFSCGIVFANTFNFGSCMSARRTSSLQISVPKPCPSNSLKRPIGNFHFAIDRPPGECTGSDRDSILQCQVTDPRGMITDRFIISIPHIEQIPAMFGGEFQPEHRCIFRYGNKLELHIRGVPNIITSAPSQHDTQMKIS